ncbi:dihydrofolate reductase family protein [Nocardioidaceae bacterium]|nr:dihydrofolate reductase family protein [Nocardioidaceae bacterium]
MTTTRAWRARTFIATSLDGFISRPDGDIEWLTDPPAEPRHVAGHAGPTPPADYDEFTAPVSHLVMGRGTYEKVASFPAWPYDRFAVVVLSTTMSDDDPRISVVRSLSEAVATLDDTGATDVYVDGGRVVSAFLEADLLDELYLHRAPVILGRGLPLFHDLEREARLVHLGTSTNDAGMTSTRYAVARD